MNPKYIPIRLPIIGPIEDGAIVQIPLLHLEIARLAHSVN